MYVIYNLYVKTQQAECPKQRWATPYDCLLHFKLLCEFLLGPKTLSKYCVHPNSVMDTVMDSFIALKLGEGYILKWDNGSML